MIASLTDQNARQPVHTVYGGAQLFRADSKQSLGRKALEALRQYAPDAATLAQPIGLPEPAAATVYERVVAKLQREPVEDYRIDFEDGFGPRPDAEEDAAAAHTATELARGLTDGTLPPFIGIRIKALTAALRTRGMRTLDIFMTTLLDKTGAALPAGFVVALPKITVPEEVSDLASQLDVLESRHGLAP